MDQLTDKHASNTQRHAKIKFIGFAVVVSALCMAIVGALGTLMHQPWLFPSLGPTIFLHTVSPSALSSKTLNTLAGHGIGLAAAFMALWIFEAHKAPALFDAEALSLSRVAATSFAVGATVGLQMLLNVQHPPAAATTMLVTLGGLKPSWSTVLSVSIGVMLVAAIGWTYRVFHHRLFVA